MVITKVIENEEGNMVAFYSSQEVSKRISLKIETSTSTEEWVITRKEAEALQFCLNEMLKYLT